MWIPPFITEPPPHSHSPLFTSESYPLAAVARWQEEKEVWRRQPSVPFWMLRVALNSAFSGFPGAKFSSVALLRNAALHRDQSPEASFLRPSRLADALFFKALPACKPERSRKEENVRSLPEQGIRELLLYYTSSYPPPPNLTDILILVRVCVCSFVFCAINMALSTVLQEGTLHAPPALTC